MALAGFIEMGLVKLVGGNFTRLAREGISER